MNFFVNQRLFLHNWRLADALKFPSRDLREIFVIALRLAVFSLILLAEMAAARFFARQGIEHEQFGELHKISHPARAFERRIQFMAIAEHVDVSPELFAQRWNLLQEFFQTGSI